MASGKALLPVGGLAIALAALRVGEWPLPVVGLGAWTGIAFAMVGLAYSGIGPRLFGKQSDGRLSPLSLALLGPYHLLNAFVFRLQARLTREPAWHEIAPCLFLGRRPLAPADLPANTRYVVDMAAEFTEPSAIRAGRVYRCLPTLDTAVPPEPEFRALVAEVSAMAEPVYVHCALGHGRSALVVAAILLERGHVASAEQAVEWIRAHRPGIGLHREQHALLVKLQKR